MPQLIGGAILVIALVLFIILFEEGYKRSNTNIPAEASPAGCVLVVIIVFMLLALVVCGIVLIFYRG